MITVGADVPEDSISSAALGLGLPLDDVTRSGVVRAVLALFHGKTRDEARSLVKPKRKTPARLGSNAQDYVTAQVEDWLADTGDTPKAFAIRVGIAMAQGATRKQAEAYARTSVRLRGYQHEDVAS